MGKHKLAWLDLIWGFFNEDAAATTVTKKKRVEETGEKLWGAGKQQEAGSGKWGWKQVGKGEREWQWGHG